VLVAGGVVPTALQVFTLALGLSTMSERVSSVLVGGVLPKEIQRGESVVSIGARFGIEPRTLAEDNHLPADRALTPGAALRVDNRHIVPCDHL
jgi:LysM domain